jgi:hypothetical protein
VSTKPKNAGPSKTAVAVAAVAIKAAAETVVVVVVDVTTAVAVDATVIAVVAVDATTGKPALQRNFKKGSPRGGPFLFSEPPVMTGEGKLKKPSLFLRFAADLVNHQQRSPNHHRLYSSTSESKSRFRSSNSQGVLDPLRTRLPDVWYAGRKELQSPFF